MKLGRLPRGLAVAAVAAVTVVPLAASSAAAAPAAPTAYALFGKAAPLVWGDPSSSVPVGSLHVPFVLGKTNNVALAKSEAKLTDPNEALKFLSGETINGLKCTGFEPKDCVDPFKPLAQVEQAGPDARHSEKTASFDGKDGKNPGSILAITDCGGNCGPQLVRSVSGAAGPAGALPGYVSVGASSASHELSIDDKGRLVSFARSQLENVSIGPNSEVKFSSLVTTAQAIGTGAENSKDGRADIRINDFYILGERVELTRAGLRLANGGPSEQEAYDGAKALVKRLKDEKGIILELPNFDAQLTKSPAYVAVDTQGLRVMFQQGVGSVNASALTYPLELGHSTAVLAALDAPGRNMDVNENSNGDPIVVDTAAPPAPPSSTQPPAPPTTGIKGTKPPRTTKPAPGSKDDGELPQGPKSDVTKPPPTTPGEVAPPPVIGPAPTEGYPPENGTNPDETALSLREMQRKLGLRDARSVSSAFGAFLGLGLILPVARFLIRRLG